MTIHNVKIKDDFTSNMKFEVIHRKEIEVDAAEDHLAYEDASEIDWLEEEDPDANIEILKEEGVINLSVE